MNTVIIALREEDSIRPIAKFQWDATEDFTELRQFGCIQLIRTKAVDILAIDVLSETSKILLSAVAGAAWQYLIDYGMFDKKHASQIMICVQ